MISENKISSKSGFSLVELLVVIAIMAIMTAVLFSMKNNDSASKDVENAAQKIVAQLRALQNDALNGRQFGGTPAATFNFNIVSASTYNATYVSSSSVVLNTLPSTTLSKVSLSPSSGNINFQSPRGDVSGVNVLTVTSPKDVNLHACIYINAGGNISSLVKAGAC